MINKSITFIAGLTAKQYINKSMIFLAAGLFALLGFGVNSFCQEDLVKLHDSSYVMHQRSPVPFMHNIHNEKADISECNVCHHVYKNGKILEDESSEDKKCSQCHFINNNKIELTRAYHLMCKGCHLEKSKGPILCGECHKDK